MVLLALTCESVEKKNLWCCHSSKRTSAVLSHMLLLALAILRNEDADFSEILYSDGLGGK